MRTHSQDWISLTFPSELFFQSASQVFFLTGFFLTGCPEGAPGGPGEDCGFPYGGGFAYGPNAENFDFQGFYHDDHDDNDDHYCVVMLMLTNAENFDLQDVVVTEWTIGATAVAGWGQVCFLTGFYLSSSQLVREPDYMTIHNPNQRDSFQVANHGGGYSYRLCKLGPGEPPSEQVTVIINVVMVMINIIMISS